MPSLLTLSDVMGSGHHAGARDRPCERGARSCGSSARLSEALRDRFRVRHTRLRTLAHERKNGGGEGSPERITLDCANVDIVESSKGVSGKVVVAARLDRG